MTLSSNFTDGQILNRLNNLSELPSNPYVNDKVIVEDVSDYGTNTSVTMSSVLLDNYDSSSEDFLLVWNGNTWVIIDQDKQSSSSSSGETSSYASSILVGQNGNQADAAYQLLATSQSVGNAWLISNTEFTLQNNAKAVEVVAGVAYDFNEADNNQNVEARVAPIIKLMKNGQLIAVGATGYQRHATGHNDSSNAVFFYDLNPQIGDVWQLRMARGSTQADTMLVTQGQFVVKAIIE